MMRLAFVHVFIVLFIVCSTYLRDADALLNRRPSGSSGATSSSSAFDDQDSWQPMHSNWIILQTAPTTPSATAAGAVSIAYNRTSNNYAHRQQKLQQPRQQKPLQTRSQHHVQQQHPQLLQRRFERRRDVSLAPTSAPSTANGIGGESFVLEISKLPDAKVSNAFYGRRQLSSVPLTRASNGDKLRRGFVNKAVTVAVPDDAATQQPTRLDINRDVANRNERSGVAAPTHLSPPTPTSASASLSSLLPSSEESLEEDESLEPTEDEQRLNELLVPLGRALDRVKYFCDVVKNVIGNNEDDDAATTSAAVSGETQGRNSHAVIGTGRKKVKKLKKKFKKFLLPLLLAYKLKFLTLIPVLIGGLTLLVGTTGLAGFFFALFTAVMSLKSGGSKSVVVKKI